MSKYLACDLFCGCGGMATGGINAIRKRGLDFEFWAVNHWYRAVQTMMANHPYAHVFEADLSSARPQDIVTCGRLNHLHASPQCTHFSRARGGKPKDPQLRAQPNWVLDWLDALNVDRLSIENVPEFVTWGPLDENGNPIKSQKGTLFDIWLKSIEARNYKLEWRVVNCADYGDATTRKRFFLKAVKKGCGEIRWPTPEFSKDGSTGRKWRGVRECIDFSDIGTSIFNRKKPLAKATMERIAVGARKYWGVDLEPFIVRMNNHCYAESIDDPCSALTTSGAHHMLCTPLVLGQQGGASCRPVDDTCPTVACGGFVRGIFPQLDDGRIVDIFIRMLRPDELARVHSFPDEYVIIGNRCEKVKQIGNSVPVRTAEAMMAADLEVA